MTAATEYTHIYPRRYFKVQLRDGEHTTTTLKAIKLAPFITGIVLREPAKNSIDVMTKYDGN
jgi:hypothetical protein